MSAPTLAEQAAAIPVPVDAYGRARAYCMVDDDLKHRVIFGLDAGRQPSAPVGPAFDKPRLAERLARLLNGESDT